MQSESRVLIFFLLRIFIFIFILLRIANPHSCMFAGLCSASYTGQQGSQHHSWWWTILAV